MEGRFLIPLALLFVGLAVGVALDTLAAWLGVPEEDEHVPEDSSTSEAYSPAEADNAIRQWRRIAIMGATGAAFAAAGARYDDPSHLALVTAYAAVLLLCAATDIMAYRVPNVVTYPAILIALGAGALMPDADLPRVLGGGALAGGILLAPVLVTRGKGLGMGDIKLAAFVGLALGLPLALAALLLMAFAGGAVAAALLLTGLRHRGDPIAYAPFISVGALAVMLWQGTAFHSLTY